MQLKIVLTILASLVPFVISTAVGSKSCKNNEFWWASKNCCLPKGGPPQPPPPPKGTNCPPTSYYWGNKQGCCVPRNPAPPNPPPPQCPKGWTWYPAVQKCHGTPTPPTTPPPKPSHQPGHGYGDGHWGDHDGKHQKRSLLARSAPCPTGLDACPVSSLAGDYECLDTSSELESCGGCSSLGEGQDCTRIEGAWNVGCHQGSCVVYTCAGGFKIGADGKSCVPV